MTKSVVRVLAGLLLVISSLTAFAQKSATHPDSGATYAKAEQAYKVNKAAFTAKPKNEKAKKAFVASALFYANQSMGSPKLSPRVKYTQALRLFREVLKADPKNVEAKSSSDTIIAIYKQMGRPVPKDGS